MKVDIQTNREFRRAFLKHLYKKYSWWVSSSEVADILAKLGNRLSIESDEMLRNVDYLVEKGYVERSMNAWLRITAEGIDFMEKEEI